MSEATISIIVDDVTGEFSLMAQPLDGSEASDLANEILNTFLASGRFRVVVETLPRAI